jgi:hypothetical protein
MPEATLKYVIKIKDQLIGSVFITTGKIEAPNMKTGSILFIQKEEEISFDSLKNITWLYPETTSNEDIIYDLVEKAGYNPEDISN